MSRKPRTPPDRRPIPVRAPHGPTHPEVLRTRRRELMHAQAQMLVSGYCSVYDQEEAPSDPFLVRRERRSIR